MTARPVAAHGALPSDDLQEILTRGGNDWEALRGRRIFLTGGTGFLGRWLVEPLLLACDTLGLGCEVALLTRDAERLRHAAPHLAGHRAVTLVEGDVRRLPALPWTPEVIVHGAAEPLARGDRAAARELFHTIVDGTAAVLALAERSGTRELLLVSSGAVYGPHSAAVAEDAPTAPDSLDPRSAYGAAKRAAESLAVLSSGDRLAVKIARCFTFLGPLLPLDGPYAAGNFLRDALSGNALRVAGDGTAIRSYLYAADLAAWLLRILVRGPGGRAFNVGSPQPIAVGELATRIAALVPGAGPVEIAQPCSDRPANCYLPCTRRAETELGLAAWTPLDTAIRKTAAWHRGATFFAIMNAAEYIARYLEKRGVPQVFELVGGMITFLLDALHQHSSIRIVSMHHEQGAAFAADGAGRIAGIPGVAMATSGPGATNLLTGIGSCHFDSVPAVFITGQVNRHEQKGARAIRQLGFQETDIVAMARPITKGAWMVREPADLPRMLEEAFALATSGRPGPVLLDVPMDVQRAAIDDLSRLENPSPAPVPAVGAGLEDFCTALAGALARAQRPLVLAGGGVRSGRAAAEFRALVETLGVPVIHSLMAVDVLPAEHRLRAGMLGSYGNRWTNLALSESDLLLVLGSRLDVRQTGADTADFQGTRAIFHVDCELGELNNRVTATHTLVAELAPFLRAAHVRLRTPAAVEPWIEHIRALRAQWPDTAELASGDGINPNVAMHTISRHSAAAAAFSVDVGQHQMWAAQSLDLSAEQRFLTSGGMGSMGYALPAAIGACFASGGRPVVVVAGDGGFQCNLQELQTVRRNALPLKIVVLNNGCHGMVRQFQESYFHGRYQSTLWGYDAPDFAQVAAAYGLDSARVERAADLDAACARMWRDPAAPFLLEVRIDPLANAYPKLAFGRPISEMEPFAKPLEMEGT